HGGHGGADTLIVQEFIRYVREDAPISTSPVGARYAVAAACCATESLRAGGRPVDVPAVDPELAAYIDQAARQATPA
ncbi:MAG: gfo/Idh/MocA family oxidoreductase, partial [Phycisphaerae bacterium]